MDIDNLKNKVRQPGHVDLNFLRNRAYQIAKDHGWHEVQKPDTHWVMLITTEISEAVQADRKGHHADVQGYKKHYNDMIGSIGDDRAFELSFEMWIKDTVEDELADIIIRALDLAGIKGYDLDELFTAAGDWGEIFDLEKCESYFKEIEFTVLGFALCKCLANAVEYEKLTKEGPESLAYLIKIVQLYCQYNDINLAWFVEMKMKYNETRPYKHGNKKY